MVIFIECRKPISLISPEEILPTGLNALVVLLSAETTGEANSALSTELPIPVVLFHLCLNI